MSKILIIEDDSFLQSLEVNKLTKSGYETMTASTGKEGIEKGIEEGIEKGREEGIEKGMEKELINTTKVLLRKKFKLDILSNDLVELVEKTRKTRETRKRIRKYHTKVSSVFDFVPKK